MAKRNWGELQKKFTEFEREGGNLTGFCKKMGISRSSAGRMIKTARQMEKMRKNVPLKKYVAEKEKKEIEPKEPLEYTKHITEEKVKFYVQANDVSRKHAAFIDAYFKTDSIRESADYLGVPMSTIESYLKNETVQRTIDDVTATAYEVETTTPRRIRGRMMAIANANLKDFFDDNGQFKEPHMWTREQGLAVKELKVKPTDYGNEYTLKMYDAMAALETLGKVHGLFDKIEDPDEVKDLTDEELEALINEQESLLSTVADADDS